VQAFDSGRPAPRRRVGVLDNAVGVPARPISMQGRGEASSELAPALQTLGQIGHETRGFETTGAFSKHGTGEPEQSGKRGAVVESRMVLDRHRNAEMAPRRYRPPPARRPAELGRYDPFVVHPLILSRNEHTMCGQRATERGARGRGNRRSPRASPARAPVRVRPVSSGPVPDRGLCSAASRRRGSRPGGRAQLASPAAR
jgi:hypothetical protein